MRWDPRGEDNAPDLERRADWLSEVDFGAGVATGGNEWLGYGLSGGLSLTLGDDARWGGYMEPSATFAIVRGAVLTRAALRAGVKSAVGRVNQVEVDLADQWHYEGRAEVVLLLGPMAVALGGGVNQHLDPLIGANLSFSFYDGERQSQARRPRASYRRRGPGMLDLVVGAAAIGLAAYVVHEILTSDVLRCAAKASSSLFGKVVMNIGRNPKRRAAFIQLLQRIYADKTVSEEEAGQVLSFLGTAADSLTTAQVLREVVALGRCLADAQSARR